MLSLAVTVWLPAARKVTPVPEKMAVAGWPLTKV